LNLWVVNGKGKREGVGPFTVRDVGRMKRKGKRKSRPGLDPFTSVHELGYKEGKRRKRIFFGIDDAHIKDLK